MNNKNNFKLLLGNTGSFGKKNKDIFLDIELRQTFNEIRPERYDNDFDIQKEFEIERDDSRNYVLYGLINSAVNTDIRDDLTKSPYQIWKEISPPTTTVDTITKISTSTNGDISLNNGSVIRYVKELSVDNVKYETGNVFGVPIKKYKAEFNVTSIDEEVIYIFVNGESLTPLDSYFINNPEIKKYVISDLFIRQPLVFRDDGGTFISYGTVTEELNTDGTTFEVNNDFPFFYNTHWVKNYINIEFGFVPNVEFSITSMVLNEGETKMGIIKFDRTSTLSGAYVGLYVPSDGNTASPSDYSFPQTIFIPKGSTSVSFPVTANVNSTIKPTRNFNLRMSPFHYTQSAGTNGNLSVRINSNQIRFGESTNEAIFIIPSTFRNLQSFDLYPDYPDFPTPLTDRRNAGYSVLRNGYTWHSNDLEFTVTDNISDRDPNSFYANDSYTIRVVNKGNNVTYPEGNDLSNQEFTFNSNDYIDLNVNQEYTSGVVHKLGLDIRNVDATDPFSIDINGTVYKNITSRMDLLNALLNDASPKTFDFYDAFGTHVSSGTVAAGTGGATHSYFIYFVSRVPGVPIVIRNLNLNHDGTGEFNIIEDGSYFNAGGSLSPANDPNGVKVSVTSFPTTLFTNSNPIPKQIKLIANSSDGVHSQYDIILKKVGYKDIVIPSQNWDTSLPSQTFYLETGFNQMKVPYISSTNSCTIPSEDSKLSIENAYVNGALFLSDKQSDKTTNIYASFNQVVLTPIGCTSLNSGNQMGGFKITS